MTRLFNEVYCNADHVKDVERELELLRERLPQEWGFDYSAGVTNWEKAEEDE